MNRSILIVDDDARVLTALSQALANHRTGVRTAASAEQALTALAAKPADIVLTDLKMPGMDGVELLQVLRARLPETEVVIMTAHEDLPTVATAMREGARDFLVKPLDLHLLRQLLDGIFEDRETRARARAPDQRPADADQLVGRDRRLVEIFKLVGQVAATSTTVIIRGESGTGKELIAREIHRRSEHASEPFVAVNCTAVPETLLESELFGHRRGSFTGAVADRKGRFAIAGRGTVFLDEIGDTAPEFQAKLLRVLQEHEFYPVGAERPERTEARVIAATHRDLEQLVATGAFREDLYYRLRVVEITVPPLRERMDDVPLLAEYFVRRLSQTAGRQPPVLSDEAAAKLLEHSWPGNVRELQNCIARALVTAAGKVIRREHVQFSDRAAPVSGTNLTLAAVERLHVARVLEATGGHKTRAAEILDISRPRLDRLIEKYQLRPPPIEDTDGAEQP
jgi:two-component system, NtrC family, response regulator HydG